MGLKETIATWLTPQERAYIPPPVPSVDNFIPFVSMGGERYPLTLQQTLQGASEPIAGDFAGLTAGGYQGNSVVFTCLNARMALFKQARFMWRQLRSGTPGDYFSSSELDILRRPWENGSTSDLLARMLQDADLGGNAFILRRGSRLARLRPDWVVIVHGSPNDPDTSMWDPESELLGYAYWPGGPGSGVQPRIYLAREVAHFAPIPDPMAPARGMSWLTPLVREIQADSGMRDHKLAYLRNGATPNLVVTGVPGATPQGFADWVDKFSGKHDGIKNAYKTLYLSGTTDAKVVGNDLAQVDFKAVQGAGETRIAAAAGVPPIVAGLSEGLAGSSLNAGNFQAAMRRFADLTGRSLWEDACSALASILRVPPAAELWYDDRYIPALKDDIKDFAEVQALQAQAIRSYVDGGFEPATVVDAVNAGDLKRLVHTGKLSVQLQEPGAEKPAPEPDPEPDDDDAEDEGRALAFQALTIARAAVDRPAPEAPVQHFHMTFPEARNEITFAPTVEAGPAPEVTVTVEPTPIEVRNEVAVEPTPVTVEAPVVNVTVPEQPVPDVVVNVPEQRAADVTVTNVVPAVTDVRIVDQPATRKTVKRDQQGLIREVTEEPL